MNCTQVKDQLIDFLYGDLSAEDTRAFTAHVESCTACKAEVASYERTLGSARMALGGPLQQEPPARIHVAVLEAAKVAAKQSTSARAKAPAPRDEVGFFARLMRMPWFLPAFGAASIATVVFLVRVLKNPEVLPGQRPHSIEEQAVATPEPAAAAHEAPPVVPEVDDTTQAAARDRTGNKLESSRAKATHPVGKPAPSAPAQAAPIKAKKAISNDPLDGLRLGEGSSGVGGLGRFAEPPPPPPYAKKKSSTDWDSLASESKDTMQAARSPQTQPGRSNSLSERTYRELENDRSEFQSEKGAAPSKAMQDDSPAAGMAKPATHAPTQSATAQAGGVQPAPEYAPAPAAAAPAPKVRRDLPAESTGSTEMATVRPAAARRKNADLKEEGPRSNESDENAMAKDQMDKNDRKAKASAPAGSPSLEDSLRKAERLYASQDWNGAAATYRDLLTRFPNHKDAPKWRDRMNASNFAYQRTLEAKRKKATSDDPLSGSMK